MLRTLWRWYAVLLVGSIVVMHLTITACWLGHREAKYAATAVWNSLKYVA